MQIVKHLSTKGRTVFEHLMPGDEFPCQMIVPLDPPMFEVGDKVCHAGKVWEILQVALERDPGDIIYESRSWSEFRLTGPRWSCLYKLEHQSGTTTTVVEIDQDDLIEQQLNQSLDLRVAREKY